MFSVPIQGRNAITTMLPRISHGYSGGIVVYNRFERAAFQTSGGFFPVLRRLILLSFAYKQRHWKTEQYISDRQRPARRKHLARDNIAPGSWRPVIHDHLSVLPYLSSQRKISFLNQAAEKPRSNDQGPLPLIPPGKGDDMAPESSRRLKGKITTGAEDLPICFFCFESPINEKELDPSILSRGKEIPDQSVDI